MRLPACKSTHVCADGGAGGCNQPEGHYGRHLCSSCMKFFGGGEATRTEPPVAESAAGQPDARPDGPGSGGGYVKDGPGSGGGYAKDSPGSGGGYVKDGPGLGGGYVKDGPGLGGGYVKDGPGSSVPYVKDGPGLGGGYMKDGPGLGGGYIKGEGVAECLSTPEQQAGGGIAGSSLPPGQVWVISPGDQTTAPALYRIEATLGPGSGVKILGSPATSSFLDSVGCGEQNLYARAKELVGDRDPQAHEFSIQLRAMDSDTSGSGLGMAVLLALFGALIERSARGGLIIAGSLNVDGSVDVIPNPLAVAKLGKEKGAVALLMPISARRQLFELPDELATRITIEFYADPMDAFLKCFPK
ncbi:MAG: hypothetical protein ABSH28_05730 [Acidobacteriota bacterium]